MSFTMLSGKRWRNEKVTDAPRFAEEQGPLRKGLLLYATWLVKDMGLGNSFDSDHEGNTEGVPNQKLRHLVIMTRMN